MAHWGIFYEFFCTDLFEKTFECTLHDVHCPKSFEVVSTHFFELCLLCYFAPLKHCAEAIELTEELSKVLRQLPCTFSFRRTRLRLRRVRSEFKGALLTILLFEDLAIDSPWHRLRACQFWLKLIKFSQSYLWLKFFPVWRTQFVGSMLSVVFDAKARENFNCL